MRNQLFFINLKHKQLYLPTKANYIYLYRENYDYIHLFSIKNLKETKYIAYVTTTTVPYCTAVISHIYCIIQYPTVYSLLYYTVCVFGFIGSLIVGEVQGTPLSTVAAEWGGPYAVLGHSSAHH